MRRPRHRDLTMQIPNKELNGNRPIPQRVAPVFHSIVQQCAITAAQAIRRQLKIDAWVIGSEVNGWNVLVAGPHGNDARELFGRGLMAGPIYVDDIELEEGET